jgi:multidrug resistance efflux pump
MKKVMIGILALFIIAFTVYSIIEYYYVSVPGVVKVRYTRNINLDFPAIIDNIKVQEGQNIHYGDVLFTLDIKDFESQIVLKKQDLIKSKNDLQMETLRLSQLRNAEKILREKLSDLDKEMEQEKVLLKKEAVSQRELDDLKKNILSVRRDYNDVSLSLKAEQNGITSENVLKSKISSIENELELLQGKLGHNQIYTRNYTSTFSNAVAVDIGYKNGDVLVNSKGIMTILDLDSIYIEAKVPESQIKYIKKGAAVKIIPLANTRKKFQGTVVDIPKIAYKSNDETYFLIEVSIKDKDSLLVPNMNLNLKINKSFNSI